MASNLLQLRPGFQRAGPSFLTRAARDEAAQLDERSSASHVAQGGRQGATISGEQGISKQRALHLDGEGHQLPGKLGKPSFEGDHDGPHQPGTQPSRGQSETDPLLLKGDGTNHKASAPSGHTMNGTWGGYKDKAPLNSSDGDSKLSTFSGVFVPTSLNVLSILMFLRFGFILGQCGVVGMIGIVRALMSVLIW
jgi:potassium/chloride transporter 9